MANVRLSRRAVLRATKPEGGVRMAVAFKMKFEGATLDQYDQVMELMGLTANGPGPDGAIFHWVAPVEGGILVMDVWESDAQFEKFAKEQIGPYTQQVGIPSEPKITRFEVHNMFVPSSTAALV
jgi:hypothetical protein